MRSYFVWQLLKASSMWWRAFFDRKRELRAARLARKEPKTNWYSVASSLEKSLTYVTGIYKVVIINSEGSERCILVEATDIKNAFSEVSKSLNQNEIIKNIDFSEKGKNKFQLEYESKKENSS